MAATATPAPATAAGARDRHRSPHPVALVTAGSAGLGAAAARLLARHGYRVAVNYAHDAARAHALVAELRRLSPLSPSSGLGGAGDAGPEGEGEGGKEGEEEGEENFIAVRADLGSKAEVVELVRQAVERLGGGRFFGGGVYEGEGDGLGRLDAVFSNGGWTRFRGWASLDANADDDDWDTAFAVNVKSHLWLLRAARPHLDRAGPAAGPRGGAFVSTASLAGVNVSGSSMVSP